MKMIVGSGGGKEGGGTPRVAQEAPDSLRSIAYAQVLDLIGEGEIEGLANGLRSVYLDGTPIQNEDGTFNFTGVSIDIVHGTQSQSYIPGVGSVESVHSVGVRVTAATPVVRTITNADVDAVRVVVTVSSLSEQNTSNGDLNGATVQFAIDVQSNGGGYVAQMLSREWRDSANPATLGATGLMFNVPWSATLTTNELGQYEYASITFQVQYRIGAGAWTTYKTDSMTTVEMELLYDSDGRMIGYQLPSRSYVISGIADALYEVRVVVTDGLGSVSVANYKIYQHVPYDTIAGKTLSPYQRSHRIELTGSPPWDIRVRRITPDSVSAALRNETHFTAYSELVDEKFTYPNSAIARVSVDASQFQSVPTRAYDVKLKRVKIPSNYNPITRTYSGVWDGTFSIAWTDNPAWCFYDLLTNTRYGLGRRISEAMVDKWGLYAIGVYCDGMVPNGYGAMEPRFTANVYLQKQEEAFNVIAAMASIFRGMSYWSSGSITAVQDAPSDSVALFTEANVEGGLFTYSGTARNARHTVAVVMWNDRNDSDKLKPEYVEDVAGIARYGLVPVTVTAFGCGSRGQAARVGRWLLYSEQSETESVSFIAGMEGAYLRPGSIFAVQDQHRAGVRHGGRIIAATSSSITLDNAVTIASGQTYSVSVILPSGVLESRSVTNAQGSATVLTVSPNFSATPQKPSVWVLTSSAVAPRLYRALSIAETDRNKYEVQGIEHNPAKFDAVEQGLVLHAPRYSTLSAIPDAPSNVVITESLAIIAGEVKVVVTVGWDAVPMATRYRVEYRRNGGNYVLLPETRVASVEIVDALPGTYEVRVVAVNILQAVSQSGTATREVYGKTAPPSDVQGFVVSRHADTLNFTWQAVPDLDVSHYEIRQGAVWATGLSLGVTINTQFSAQTNVGATYLIKAFDTSGNESVNASAIIGTSNTDINVVVTANDAPTWPGVRSGTRLASGGVTLDGQKTWANWTGTWASYTGSWLLESDLFPVGTYETVPVDLGQAMTSRVELTPTVTQLAIGVTWADFVLPWSSYVDAWTAQPLVVSASYEMAISQDGVTYSAWQTFMTGTYVGQAYKFRVTLRSSDVRRYIPVLTSLLVSVDVPDRVLHFEDVATSPAGTTLTFSPPFVNVQTVTGTIQAGAVGDTFRVTSKTNASAVVTVYDSAGVAKAGSVDLDVFGYGALS